MADYVFTMIRASKFYGPERKVLDDITLAFLPGAKIGVLGPNGAGKSTLLRIMAGVEETSSGRADLAAGASVGLLSQEPELDASKDVRGNVEDGVRPLQYGLGSVRRARRRLRRPPRRAGRDPGADRPRRRVEPRRRARPRHGRVAGSRRRS
jgi:ATPase subunit of ABC transporter with duplicated ATPase domains